MPVSQSGIQPQWSPHASQICILVTRFTNKPHHQLILPACSNLESVQESSDLIAIYSYSDSANTIWTTTGHEAVSSKFFSWHCHFWNNLKHLDSGILDKVLQAKLNCLGCRHNPAGPPPTYHLAAVVTNSFIFISWSTLAVMTC